VISANTVQCDSVALQDIQQQLSFVTVIVTVYCVTPQRVPRDPGVAPVLLGYLVSVLVCLAALCIAAVTIANDRGLPITLSGYRYIYIYTHEYHTLAAVTQVQPSLQTW
jgi:hypothetical protein